MWQEMVGDNYILTYTVDKFHKVVFVTEQLTCQNKLLDEPGPGPLIPNSQVICKKNQIIEAKQGKLGASSECVSLMYSVVVK